MHRDGQVQREVEVSSIPISRLNMYFCGFTKWHLKLEFTNPEFGFKLETSDWRGRPYVIILGDGSTAVQPMVF